MKNNVSTMKHSTKNNFAPDKIIELCNDFLTTNNQNSLDVMHKLCYEQIFQGNKENIERLLSLTDEKNYEFILEMLDEISTERKVYQKDSSGKTTMSSSKIMAIPVKGVISKSNTDSMLSKDDIKKVTESFRKNNLISDEHGVVLLPYLFSYDSLPSDYIDVFQMHENIISHVFYGNTLEAHELNGLNNMILKSNNSFPVSTDTQSIKFIVGLYIGDNVIESMTDRVDDELFNSGLSAWYNDIDGILSKYFLQSDGVPVSSSFPEDYFSTIKISLIEHEIIGCFMSFFNILKTIPDPYDLKISVYFDEDEGCCVLYLMKDMEMLDAYSIQLTDCSSDIAELLSDEIINLASSLELSSVEWIDHPIKLCSNKLN